MMMVAGGRFGLLEVKFGVDSASGKVGSS